MRPDDPRHGTKAGYNVHYRDGERPCAACIDARYYTRKRLIAAHRRGERMFYTSAEVNALVAPWLTMGISLGAISVAARYGSQRSTRLAQVLAEGGSVRRGTYHRLAAVTEADFADDAKVYADLTRTRVYSLMAIGHRQVDMPINPGGHWRTRAYITVETARNVREFYAAHEFTIGPRTHTASRARNAGHLPPLSWDDPGTLAWPSSDRRTWARAKAPKVDVPDPVVVERLLAGLQVRSTRAEKDEAMRRWLAAGRSQRSLCAMHGWAENRYVERSEAVA
jgi:hypothetical protein